MLHLFTGLALAAMVGSHALPWQSGKTRTDPWILVAGDCSDSVFGYDLAQPGAPQVYYVFEGLTFPTGLAVDAQGYVYVANAPITCAAHSSDVMVYDPGQQFPSLELVGLASPMGIAVDAQREVYVANQSGIPDITVYKPGQAAPFHYFVSNLIVRPFQLFFDRNGDLYLADSVGGVSVLKNGAPSFRSLHLQGLVEPTGVVVDPANGDVIVSDATTKMIRVYASGATLPKRLIDSHGYFPSTYLAIGDKRHDWLFVSNSCFDDACSVSVYKHGAVQPFLTIPTASIDIEGLAFKGPEMTPP